MQGGQLARGCVNAAEPVHEARRPAFGGGRPLSAQGFQGLFRKKEASENKKKKSKERRNRLLECDATRKPPAAARALPAIIAESASIGVASVAGAEHVAPHKGNPRTSRHVQRRFALGAWEIRTTPHHLPLLPLSKHSDGARATPGTLRRGRAFDRAPVREIAEKREQTRHMDHTTDAPTEKERWVQEK